MIIKLALFIFLSVPPYYLGTVNVIVATDHFGSNGESPTYTVCAYSIISKARCTRNLAIQECNITIVAYLTCYTANRSDGLISLGQ